MVRRDDDRTDPTTESPAQSSPPTGGHPPPDELLDYHEGALSPGAEERVREHLVHCRECSDAVLDFAAFPALEPPEEGRRLTKRNLDERWRELSLELDRRARPAWQRHEVLLPLAAVLLVAAVALGAWGVGLQRQVAELQGPRSDTYLVADLRPEGRTFRGGGEVVEVPAWAERLAVLLPVAPGELEGLSDFTVTVRGPRGGTVVEGVRVRPNPEGDFTLTLPRRLLPPGEYRVELRGARGGERVPVARYPVTVEAGRR